MEELYQKHFGVDLGMHERIGYLLCFVDSILRYQDLRLGLNRTAFRVSGISSPMCPCLFVLSGIIFLLITVVSENFSISGVHIEGKD